MNLKMISGMLAARCRQTSRLVGAAATGLLLLSACSEMDEDPRAAMTTPFTFYLQTTTQQATRAYQGEVGSTGVEGKINSLKVWLFDHDDPNKLLLSYVDTYTDAGTDGLNSNNDVKKVTLEVPHYIIEQGRTVDLYAIANAPSAGNTVRDFNAATTPAALEAATLGGTYFNPLNPTTDVPAAGLPYATMLKGWDILESAGGTGFKLKETLPQVKMTRAVSKVKFAFARTTDNTGVQVVGVVLDGDKIATNEYLFPKDQSNPDYAADYTAPYWGDLQTNLRDPVCDPAAMMLGSTDGSSVYLNASGIATHTNPKSLSWASNTTMTAQQYDQLIDNYTTATTVYLRESSKKLTGTIYYRTAADGDIFAKTFTMEAENDFARNHEWIVYGYFVGHQLVLEAYAVPWYYWLAQTDYTENVTMTKTLEWANELSITEQTMIIGGQDIQCKVVALRPNGTVDCTFIFDTPYRGTWMAMLETVNDTQEDAIVFADGTTAQTGSIGSEVTLTIRPRNASSTTNHYSRLRFVCYSESGDQHYAVGSEILGGEYVIAQYAN